LLSALWARTAASRCWLGDGLCRRRGTPLAGCLARKPKGAIAFYSVLALSAAIGIALNFTSINPISALFWSAVINGVLAVPVMVLLMIMARART